MGYNLAVKGEIPTKKVTPDASKRRLTNNKCGITTQICAQSAPYKEPMGYNLAVKGEIPTKKATPDASKRRLTNNKCGITTQIGARSAHYKTNVSSPRR
jgi:hypothetical protein